MTSGVFAKALAAGDPVAIELLDEAVAALGAAIASAVTLLDLPLVVVGGGLADRLGPAFVGRIEQAARGELFPRNPTAAGRPRRAGRPRAAPSAPPWWRRARRSRGSGEPVA